MLAVKPHEKGEQSVQNVITINQVTYHVNRIYSKKIHVSSIIQDLMIQEMNQAPVLTTDKTLCYNESRGTVGQKEAT